LVTLVLARIEEGPKDEIVEGLHALWPYTRHITRNAWLEVLFEALDSIAPSTPLRQDARASMERFVRRTPEEEEEVRMRRNERGSNRSRLEPTGAQTTPLASYLRQSRSHEYYGFMYEPSSSSFLEDTSWSACSFLVRVALDLSIRWRAETLFWGVLGGVYETVCGR